MRDRETGTHATRLTLIRGDITAQNTRAIVNAANSSLLGGGGVDGAIHRRGGPAILEECRALRAGQLRNGLPPGHAVSTTAGDLPAGRVIHTVGPVWRGGASGEPETLSSCWRSALECARDEGLRTVAFPSISTGAYGYPVDLAAGIAIRTVHAFIRENPGALDEVRIVLFSEADFLAYNEMLVQLRGDAAE